MIRQNLAELGIFQPGSDSGRKDSQRKKKSFNSDKEYCTCKKDGVDDLLYNSTIVMNGIMGRVSTSHQLML